MHSRVLKHQQPKINRALLSVPKTTSRTMSFFPRSFITHQAPSTNGGASSSSFTPLFRLLDDFENYQSSCSQLSNTKSSTNRNSGTTALRSFNPRFDVKELADAYELHGELPGVEQKDLNIEFTDNETLLIKGHSVREHVIDNLNGNGTNNEQNATPALEASKEPESLTEQPHASSSSSSHQASVADATEEEDGEDNASTTTTGGGGGITPATTTVAETSSSSASQQQPQQPEAKYWIAERSVGSFARSFSFPVRVDQDAVTARLQNGILSVRVPKVKRPEGGRRIVVA